MPSKSKIPERPKVLTPPDIAERISDSDMERHVQMVQHYKEAEQMRVIANELVAACNVWGRDLVVKYGLGETGQVLEDGRIVRDNGT